MGNVSSNKQIIPSEEEERLISKEYNKKLKKNINKLMHIMTKDYILEYKFNYIKNYYDSFEFSNYYESLVMFLSLNLLLNSFIIKNINTSKYNKYIAEIKYLIDRFIKIDIDPLRLEKQSNIEFSIDKFMFFIYYHCIRSFLDSLRGQVLMMKTFNFDYDYDILIPKFNENMNFYFKDLSIDESFVDKKMFLKLLKMDTTLRFRNYFYSVYNNLESSLGS